LRHAYQHAAVDSPDQFVVSTPTTQAWQSNFDNYIKAEKDFTAYENQIIETNARDFGEIWENWVGTN
jgi:hypothetical protein